jgi:hypothetical protein
MALGLVATIDTENQQVRSNARHKTLARVVDEKIPVGDSAVERLELDRAGPERQRADLFGVDNVVPIYRGPPSSLIGLSADA